MNLHPALIAVIIVDAVAVVTLLVAMVGAIRVATGWDDGAASRKQLLLERVAEQSSVLGRAGMGLVAGAGLLLVIVVNHVLPSLVPGAMCGVGALQAMPGGTTALAVRAAALLALWCWANIDSLDRSAPRSPLATASARALLVSVPIAVVAAWQTAKALWYVDVQHAVSCCAAVYDLASEADARGGILPTAGLHHAAMALVAAAALVATALLIRRKTRHGFVGPLSAVAWAGLLIVWTLFAGWTMVDVAGPYLYRALGHRCPLCLFLPHHGAVGYALYGALVGAVAEAVTVATATVVGSRCEQVATRARTSVARAALGMALSVALFVVLAVGPAVVWRIRFGVWIDG